jgi:hypothetical protein
MLNAYTCAKEKDYAKRVRYFSEKYSNKFGRKNV